MGKTKKPILAYILGVSSAVTWGGAIAVVKDTTNELHLIELMASRMIIAVIVMTLFILIRKIEIRFKKKDIGILLLIGILEPCIYGMLEVEGIALTTATEASIVLALAPMASLIVAALFLKQRVTKIQFCSIIISILGVIIVALFGGNLKVGGEITGYIFLLTTLVVGAIYAGVVAKVSKNYSAFEITYMMNIVGLIFFNTLNFVLGFGVETYTKVFLETDHLLPILYLGTLSSFWAYFAYNYTLSKLSIHIAGTLVLIGTTVVGVIAGILFLGEAATIGTLIGTLCMLGGIVGVNWVRKNKKGNFNNES